MAHAPMVGVGVEGEYNKHRGRPVCNVSKEQSLSGCVWGVRHVIVHNGRKCQKGQNLESPECCASIFQSVGRGIMSLGLCLRGCLSGCTMVNNFSRKNWKVRNQLLSDTPAGNSSRTPAVGNVGLE